MSKCHHRMASLLLPALLAAFGSQAMAGAWKVCDLRVLVMPPTKQDYGVGLDTIVVSVKPRGNVQCPQPLESLRFLPETVDYQSVLPLRQWPKPGRTVIVRYRYLDGECKDRGPCRIQHYSLLPHH